MDCETDRNTDNIPVCDILPQVASCQLSVYGKICDGWYEQIRIYFDVRWTGSYRISTEFNSPMMKPMNVAKC
jgi:hypothetical protein